MNNDIARNINYAKSQNPSMTKEGIKAKEEILSSDAMNSSKSMQDTMSYLGALGHAQVNLENPQLNKRVQQSVEQLRKNPELIEAHTKFCDSLVQRGYSLEDAIATTDKFFNILSQKDLYN